MPEIFSIAAGDGGISKFLNQSGAWAATRASSTGNSFSTLARSSNGATTQHIAARGSAVAGITRTFFAFNTIGITVAPSAATLKIFGFFRNTADVIAVRSTHSNTLANGDFDALHNSSTELGNSDANGAGSLAGVSGLTYSAELATWSNTGYNNIVLNSTALSDMASLDTFRVAVLEYDRDYLDVAPLDSAFVGAGMYFSDFTGTTRDPKIDYTASTIGGVLGVASANIGKINGVAAANVGKVIGVD